jgi:tetratricopeptide (TPR) repeat protein
MKYTSRMRQWARAAWGLAILLASLPVASRVFLGSWGFPEAADLSFLCLAAGAYLEITGRRRLRALRDDAAALEKALSLATEGRIEPAIAILTRAIRLSPRLWQAYQYRGQLRLRESDSWGDALADFNEAIRLAPKESHLYALRSEAYRQLGDDSSARRDSETALALSHTVS